VLTLCVVLPEEREKELKEIYDPKVVEKIKEMGEEQRIAYTQEIIIKEMERRIS
jgi:hypothetical protein